MTIENLLPLLALLLLPMASSFSFVPTSSSRLMISQGQKVFPQAQARTSKTSTLEMKKK
jgi:hypothetical protein